MAEPLALLIKIQGKEYPFPSFDTLSYRESKLIKRETDLRMGQFYEALDQGDTDALMALALIAKQREDKGFDAEAMYDLVLTEIEIVVPVHVFVKAKTGRCELCGQAKAVGRHEPGSNGDGPLAGPVGGKSQLRRSGGGGKNVSPS